MKKVEFLRIKLRKQMVRYNAAVDAVEKASEAFKFESDQLEKARRELRSEEFVQGLRAKVDRDKASERELARALGVDVEDIDGDKGEGDD